MIPIKPDFVINMSKGNPLSGIPSAVLDELSIQLKNIDIHKYPVDELKGMFEVREAISEWYLRKYKVQIDPNDEVILLSGSKEGIHHLALSHLEKGDIVLLTDPCYPVYVKGIKRAGATPFFLPINHDNNFLPDLSKIPEEIIKKTKLIILNYPNNPTGAVATDAFYERALRFAIDNNIIIISDHVYSEFDYKNIEKLSILSLKGAKEVCIELNSFSKTFNMAGWRIGMAVGNKEILKKISNSKSTMDAGIFMPLQLAAIKALSIEEDKFIEKNYQIYLERRKIAIHTFKELGWNCEFQEGTFYIWLPCKWEMTSEEFCDYILEKAKINVIPGSFYGEEGKGFVRISLSTSSEEFNECIKRFKKVLEFKL
jgi:LL-diaminopimelate aminotransferase